MKTIKHNKTSKGFTLVEMLITMGIVAVMATVGLPGVRDFFDKEELIGATEQLYSHLQQARMESMARSTPVYANFSANGSPWAYGLSHKNGCNPAVTNTTDAASCVLVINDGDAVVDTGDGSTDSDDLVLMRFTNTEHSNVEAAVAGGNLEFRFDPVRGTATTGEVDLTSAQGRKLRVTVGLLGKIHICTPDGSMNGYRTCA